MRLAVLAGCLAALIWAGPARAEVASASPGGFMIRAQAAVAVDPDRAWRAVVTPGQWWNSEHTYSGEARRMSLDPRAGGCWCERWTNSQSVEHGRVVMVTEHEGVQTLRLMSALGPLQELGVTGVLTYTVGADPAGAKITMTYRVTGDTGLGLEGMAPLIDRVLMEQFERLSRYTTSGQPD
jgi:hypothetical protein